MFNNTSKKAERSTGDMVETIIGESAVIEGTIRATETTRIDGTIKGEVLSQGTVIIGERGKVEGDISAVNILVAGTVAGNLRIQEKMEVTSTGTINGDIFTKTLIIDEGASFMGSCTMDKQQTSAGPFPSQKEEPAEEAKSGLQEAQVS